MLNPTTNRKDPAHWIPPAPATSTPWPFSLLTSLPNNIIAPTRLPPTLPPLHNQPIQLEELTHNRLPLHHLQLLQPLLNQLLCFPLIEGFLGVGPERVDGAAAGVFAEVVGRELGGLAEERTKLGREAYQS